MNRPDAAVLREVGGRLRMPILCRHDERASIARVAHLAVDDLHDPLTTGHSEAARRIGEVVLEVDDDEGRVLVVTAHACGAGQPGKIRRRRRYARDAGLGGWGLSDARYSARTSGRSPGGAAGAGPPAHGRPEP